MALDTTTQPTPDPAATSAPATTSSGMSGADTSAAPTAAPVAAAPATTAPAATPNDAAATSAAMAPFQAKEQAATQRAADLANQPAAVPASGPHQRLIQMVQGLALGAGAFGKAIATHGREGGIVEIQQVQGEQQQQKIQAQQAAAAQKNTQIAQQLAVADTNHKLAQNILFMHTIPNEMAKSDLEVSSERQRQAITGADFAATHMGLSPDDFNKAMSGAPGAAGAPNTSGASAFKSHATQTLDAASQILGPNDKYVQNLQSVLSNPNATPKDLWTASQQIESQEGFAAKVTASKAAQEAAATNAPFGPKADALNAAMLSRYQVLNPGAKTLPPGLSMDANSTPKDFDRADKILQQTESAQATKSNRDIVNGMRQQTLALSGLGAPGGNTSLGGTAYLQSLPAPEQALVSEIGSGKIAPTRMDMLLSRNPKLVAEVALAYPEFDSSKAASYPATYKDFTAGKTSVALNAGGTALGHLKELQELNTAGSHIPHTPAWTKYQNKVDTVASELAKFYGDASIPAIASIKETLASTLPGNREAAIQTQAQSMGDKLDAYETEWKNAAPSKSYEAPMPFISDKAKAARAALDPNYAAAQKQNGGGTSAAAPTVAAPAAPAGATSEVRVGGKLTGHVVGNKYVPLGQ
jgi:hypothetical protein